MFGAADTFRAAAIEQLELWSKKIGADFVKSDLGTDPASVGYKTAKFAEENNSDLAFIDTAGRLHNNVNLMRELGKIRNVMEKVIPNSPHDVMLVLDASTGQNAIEQATQFTAATEVDSIVITKLDGTAKGGILIAVAKKYKIPIIALGLGEKEDDLQIFEAEKFADAFTQIT